MSNNLLNTIYLALGFLMLFASAEFLYHTLKVKAEITRKYLHISTGMLALLFPFLIGDHILVLILCGLFLIILLLSIHLELLPSIHAIDRSSRGSILYPVVVYLCYFAFSYYDRLSLFYLPVLILAICDPVAGLTGKKWPAGSYKTFGRTKTMSGSLAFFITAVVLSIAIISSLEKAPGNILTIGLVMGTSTTIAEAFTHKGYDNLTIPLSALIISIIVFECL